ncbi:MAG: signal peptide peptidase SppA [Betaproteobacteria bacterium]|nr:signal peptide peptidase SppA [Betaproteobacteria bacterium]MCL2161805.1 signal peptide peptidase SppA [Betaproteobacteria bacterium]
MLKFIARLLRHIWLFIDGARRVAMNLILLLIIVMVIAAIAHPGPTVPKAGAALLVRPVGTLVEQATFEFSLSSLSDEQQKETPLPDLLEAIRAARDDSRIKLIVLETDKIEGGGLAKFGELRAAIADFKTSGKKVLARGEHFNQNQYFLASIADEVHLAPDGHVLLQGLARFPTYYRGALDKLGVKVHLFRGGEYKSFGEPFTRNDMSKEDREASLTLLNGLWGHIRSEISAARKLTPETFDQYTLDYLKTLKAAKGDPAAIAQSAGFIDRFSTRDQWRARIKESLGGADSADKDYRHINASDYLTAVRRARPEKLDQIAVLVAQGTIVDGEQPPGSVGGDSFARLIRQARENKRIKALVIRIDSPGGSAGASEVIRRELELTREAGKPVVASMSSLAASGGYWIAAGSDEIFAEPATLTGSIGVWGMFPEFSDPLGKLGLSVDGVATAPLAAALDPRRPLDPAVAEALQLNVEHTYRRFLETVAKARKMEPDAVDKIAQGRVWSGQEALDLGLVDHVGGLDAALLSAASRAKLKERSYSVTWPTQSVPPMRQLLKQIFGTDNDENPAAARSSPTNDLLVRLAADLKSLALWNDPRHIYMHCLCEMP